MATLIARHTVLRIIDGVQTEIFPGTKFDVDDEVEAKYLKDNDAARDATEADALAPGVGEPAVKGTKAKSATKGKTATAAKGKPAAAAGKGKTAAATGAAGSDDLV